MSVKPNKSKKLKLIATATVVTLCTTVITSSTTAHASGRNFFSRAWNTIRTCFGLCPPAPPRTTSLGDQGGRTQNLGTRARLRRFFGFGGGNRGGSGSGSPSTGRPGGSDHIQLHDITRRDSDSRTSGGSTGSGGGATGGQSNVTFYDEYGNKYYAGTLITEFTSEGIDRQVSSASSSSSGSGSVGRVSSATAGSKGSSSSSTSIMSRLSDGIKRIQRLKNPEQQDFPGPRSSINRFMKYTQSGYPKPYPSASGGIDNKGFDGSGGSSGGASTSPKPARPTPPTSTTTGGASGEGGVKYAKLDFKGTGGGTKPTPTQDKTQYATVKGADKGASGSTSTGGEGTVQYADLKFKTGAGGGTKPTTPQDKTQYATVKGADKGASGSTSTGGSGGVDYSGLGARPKTQGTSGGTGGGGKKVRFADSGSGSNIRVSSSTTKDGTVIDTNFDENTGRRSLTVRPGGGKTPSGPIPQPHFKVESGTGKLVPDDGGKKAPPVAPKPKFTPPTTGGGDKKTPPPVAPKPKLTRRDSDNGNNGDNNGGNKGPKNFRVQTYL